MKNEKKNNYNKIRIKNKIIKKKIINRKDKIKKKKNNKKITFKIY